MNISSDFVKKCKGLPLEIVAIGSLLDDKEKTPFEWEIIRQSLSSEMEKKSTFSWYIAKILGFTCDDFPYCLKLCFFYFGIYLEDYEVQSTRLIRQWIAKALVKDKDGKTLEDVAQQYLTKLIGRSLVQVSSFSIDGVVVFLKKFSASVFIFFFIFLSAIISTPLMSAPRLMLTPPPMPPPQPMPTPSPMPTPLPMSTAPPCPAPVQTFLPLFSGPLPMPVLHLSNLGLVRTTISFNKFLNIVPPYGIVMAAYKLQSVAFALCTTAKPGAIRRNKLWDPGITFGSHVLNPQHLEDKVFLQGPRNDREARVQQATSKKPEGLCDMIVIELAIEGSAEYCCRPAGGSNNQFWFWFRIFPSIESQFC